MARRYNGGATANETILTETNRQQNIDRGSSPALSVAGESDKENQNQTASRSSLGKRKHFSTARSRTMQSDDVVANKRRRLEERTNGQPSQSARQRELADQVDVSFYDPEQDERTKRATLKQYRDLHSQFNDSRVDYLQRGSRGIQDTITEADRLLQDVKQTSTAAVDSRLLVNVGDLAYKKINTMNVGDSSTRIDVDDFLSKCIGYMRSATSTSDQSTQRRRQRNGHSHHNGNASDEELEDVTDLNFSHFGATMCFPASLRPCLSSFLLGPLSVQKKQRLPTQRRATQRNANLDPSQASRPIALNQEELDRQESLTLTSICSSIAALLSRTQSTGEKFVEQEVDALPSEPSEPQLRKIMAKHNLSDNGGVPLFNFCVNPKSFGQTVENFFYVSFLIKEGKVGLDFDSDELPTLSMVESQRTVEQRQETQRNQAVFSLDFDVWEELIESFDIVKSVIPHRDDTSFHELNLAYRHRDETEGRHVQSQSARVDLNTGADEEDSDMYGPS